MVFCCKSKNAVIEDASIKLNKNNENKTIIIKNISYFIDDNSPKLPKTSVIIVNKKSNTNIDAVNNVSKNENRTILFKEDISIKLLLYAWFFSSKWIKTIYCLAFEILRKFSITVR